jgi:hypothetical protein
MIWQAKKNYLSKSKLTIKKSKTFNIYNAMKTSYNNTNWYNNLMYYFHIITGNSNNLIHPKFSAE